MCDGMGRDEDAAVFMAEAIILRSDVGRSGCS